jgi:hypothetical protein
LNFVLREFLVITGLSIVSVGVGFAGALYPVWGAQLLQELEESGARNARGIVDFLDEPPVSH